MGEGTRPGGAADRYHRAITTQEPTETEAADPPASNHRRTALLLGLAVLAVLVPFVKEYHAQTAARYTFTAALVEQQTLKLDDYEHALGIDRSDRGGHVYSDKAPGQPFLAVPFYAAARAVGVESATNLRVHENLGAWWITIWFATLPAAVLCALLFIHARRWYPDTAAYAAPAVLFSTLLLPMAVDLHAHVLAATLGFGAWHVISSRPPTAARVLAAGALAGFAIAVEYPLLLVAAVIGGWLLWERRLAHAAIFSLGAAPFLLFVGWYHNAAFGDPFTTPYAQKFSDPDSAGVSPSRIPDPAFVLQIIGGSRGLIFTPVLLVGLWYLVRHLRRSSGPIRTEAAVCVVIFVGYLLLQASWPNPWGGEMPGPRYMITAFPFMVTGIAAAWRERPVGLYVAVGAVAMGLALITQTLVGRGGAMFVSHVHHLSEYGLTPTVFTMGLGPAGWVVHLAIALVAGRWALGAARQERLTHRPSRAAPASAP
jgi:hypothetical protein